MTLNEMTELMRNRDHLNGMDYAGRYGISDDEAARIAAVTDSVEGFEEVWENECWWIDGQAQSLRESVLIAAKESPAIWLEGYAAAKRRESAITCPYTPRDEDKMYAWLSGHVTATDEMGEGQC